METTDVLVVGAGPAGLSMGLFLDWHGIKALMIERHEGYSEVPSAFGLHARSVEVFRQAGLDTVVRRAAARAGLDHLRGILGVRQLAGDEGRWLLPPDVPLFDPSPVSPTGGVYCPQKLYDEALAEEALRRGVDLRFGVELYDFEQDADGVTAIIGRRGTRERRPVRARYLIAADGAKSLVRQRLGIARTGQGTIIDAALTITFRADLTEALAGRTFFLAAVDNDDYRGVLTRRDNRDLWAAGTNVDSAEFQGFTEERAVTLVRAAVGLPNLPVEIVRLTPWSAGMFIADRFRDGRVLLVGDAAHTMPPTGGFGGNVGIQDAHNLSWKLAGVLHGWAGPRLLDTYEAERRPVAWETAEQAVLRTEMEAMSTGAAPGSKVDDLAVILGYRYTSFAVIGSPYPTALPDRFEPTADPGQRAPHLTISKDGKEISTLDLFGDAFVLLTGADSWYPATKAVAAELGVPLTCFADANGLSTAYRMSAGSAILVRPDGFIAWRTDSAEDPQPTLCAALRRLLAR